jgi:hypothetical protein
MPTYQSPGVFREDVFQKPKASLPTGVPGFVGFTIPQDDGSFNVPVALHRKEEFPDKFESLDNSYLEDVVSGFFDNGGISCYVAPADANEGKNGLISALDALAPLTDLDLVAVPDAMTLPLSDAQSVQQAVLAHCADQGNRFAILDAIRDDQAGNLTSHRNMILTGQKEPVNGALYYPWIKTAAGRIIPPCGHIAGIYARTDGKAGVHKAPANEEVRGIIDLETVIDDDIQKQLNPESINCLRAFPGRGIRVWGARTLGRDPAWRYINIRRLVLTLIRWLDANMSWAAFEPNTERLWMRIRRELGVHLEKLWRSGALKGETAEQAFYVKCDAETNPAEEREAGRTVTEIGLAPASPAEFIVVRIMHRAGTTELD